RHAHREGAGTEVGVRCICPQPRQPGARRESERTTIIAQRLLWERCFVDWWGTDHLLYFSATLRTPGGSRNRIWRARPHLSTTVRTRGGQPRQTAGRARRESERT
ncbi:unnamed protein product, partial [Ectocarpus sp. 12 AP-2014]